jgi:hypothetical protein
VHTERGRRVRAAGCQETYVLSTWEKVNECHSVQEIFVSQVKVQASPVERNVSRLGGEVPYLATQLIGEFEEPVESGFWHAAVAGRSDDCIVGLRELLCEESWLEGAKTYWYIALKPRSCRADSNHIGYSASLAPQLTGLDSSKSIKKRNHDSSKCSFE